MGQWVMGEFQFSFWRHHSAETALLNVRSDILMAADDKQVALLDLSAAFDCVDQTEFTMSVFLLSSEIIIFS